MINEELLKFSSITISNSLSIIACICFFFLSRKLPRRTLGVKSTLINVVGDLLVHGTTLVLNWFPQESFQDINLAILQSSIRFSVLWVAVMAYLMYLLVNMNQVSRLKKHFRSCLIVVITVSLGIELM